MKSFVEAQFGYCPLVWLFYGREILLAYIERLLTYMKVPTHCR